MASGKPWRKLTHLFGVDFHTTPTYCNFGVTKWKKIWHHEQIR
jgi:transposase